MLDSELHFLLLKCFHYSQKMIVRQTSQLQLLPGQPKILECLYELDGQTPKCIGEACVLDKSTMTSLLKKMEAQNLIRREEQSLDKRSVRIYLTEHGRNMAETVSQICRSVDEAAVRQLSQEQKTNLIQSLQHILSNYEVKHHE